MDFYSDWEAAAAAAGTCAGDQAVLICTRQRPVGRKERINFTLERRSNCHLRICRRISIFPLLSSRWSVKGRVNLTSSTTLGCVGHKAEHLPSAEHTGGQTEITHSAHTASKDRSAALTRPLSPRSSHPAARQQSITRRLKAFFQHTQLIDIFSTSKSSSLGSNVDTRC